MTVIRCTYCGQVNEHGDYRGGCPTCGAPLWDMVAVEQNAEEGIIPYIDLTFGSQIITQQSGEPIRTITITAVVPAKGKYWYDIRAQRTLHCITFTCPSTTKARDVRYRIMAETHLVLDIHNVATTVKAPVGLDTRDFHTVSVEIGNDSDRDIVVEYILQTG